MKKYLFIILCAITLFSCKKSSTTPTPSSDIDLSKGLQLYLKFDNNFADSSGNNNAVTSANGNPLSYDEHGNANNAFNATGNGERLIVTNNGSIQFDTAFSISLNFMLRDYRKQTLVSMAQYETGAGASFIVGTNIPDNNYLNFAVNDTGTCDNGGGFQNVLNGLTEYIPVPESWYNLICVYDKGTLTVSLNGAVISVLTSTGTKPLLCSDSKIIIGGWVNDNTQSLNGKIDDFRLYNRVLNYDEIYELSMNFQ